MKDLIESILCKEFVEAKDLLREKMEQLVYEKLDQKKEDLFRKICGPLAEGNVTRMGRTKLVKVRIRNGKVQRRKKLSAVKGYTIRGGKLTRMSPLERRHRKMAAKRSKFKRRAKLRQSLRKRRMSLRKRTAMGL